LPLKKSSGATLIEAKGYTLLAVSKGVKKKRTEGGKKGIGVKKKNSV